MQNQFVEDLLDLDPVARQTAAALQLSVGQPALLVTLLGCSAPPWPSSSMRRRKVASCFCCAELAELLLMANFFDWWLRQGNRWNGEGEACCRCWRWRRGFRCWNSVVAAGRCRRAGIVAAGSLQRGGADHRADCVATHVARHPCDGGILLFTPIALALYLSMMLLQFRWLIRSARIRCKPESQLQTGAGLVRRYKMAALVLPAALSNTSCGLHCPNLPAKPGSSQLCSPNNPGTARGGLHKQATVPLPVLKPGSAFTAASGLRWLQACLFIRSSSENSRAHHARRYRAPGSSVSPGACACAWRSSRCLHAFVCNRDRQSSVPARLCSCGRSLAHAPDGIADKQITPLRAEIEIHAHRTGRVAGIATSTTSPSPYRSRLRWNGP